MNCTYTAFENAIKHLGLPVYATVWDKYKAIKETVYGSMNPYVFAGIVPWMYGEMVFAHNQIAHQKMSMLIQWQYVTWGEVYEEADEKHKAIMHFMTEYKGYQVDKITLKPAIYGMLNEQHAMFAEEIPTYPGARIVIAVQLNRWHEKASKNGDYKTTV